MEIIKQQTKSLLERIGQYTKIDMVYFAKGGFWLNLNFLFSSLTSFALSVAFAHFIPKETYGVYQYVLSIASILTAFSLTGMNTAITQSVANGFDRTVKESIPLQFKWSIFSSLGAVAISGYYFLNGAPIFGLSFLAIALFLPVINTMNTYNPYLTGKKDFKRFFIFNSIFNIIYFGVMIITIILNKNPFYLILSYLLAGAAINTLLYFKCLREVPPNNKKDSENFSYGKHLSLLNILNVIATKADSIIVFQYLGAADLAIYTFAKIIPDKIIGLFKSVMQIALPKLTQKSPSLIKRRLNVQVVQLFFVALLCSFIFILLAPAFYKIFFPKYENSIPYAQIYSLSMIALAAYLPSTILLSKKAIKELYFLNILNPLLQLTLLFFSLYYFGLIGIIMAKIINQILSLSTYWTVATKKLKSGIAEENI